MPTLLNTGTKDIPLDFARQLSKLVNQEWDNGSFLSKVTPVTQDLLRFWFGEAFCSTRYINFHKGQKQAILNAIYCHEILKADSILSMYQQASQDLLTPNFFNYIANDKFQHPKYCIKMATGTGKTFVLNALLIWQYLNAKFKEVESEVKFTKNFLLVAPGLIVYERLLDAFLGKEQEDGTRDFLTSDIKRNENLFIPDKYRQTIFSFIQNNVVRKEEIGKKVTGEGLIAITNWHLLSGAEEDEDETEVSPLEEPSRIIQDLLPIVPGTTAGHELNTLDNRFLKGGELEYLQSLENICVFNDEAHHIHENKSNGIVTEVEWQKSLNFISENKGRNFIQIDFSATPYDVTGSGQKRTKHYFPHIIVDFALKEAIRDGLVKTIAIDKRKELASLENEELDFKAVRDGKKVVDLSDGQRLMLRAGLSKLKILEDAFTKEAENKYPKMLIICEDTKVSPLVCEFLKSEGLTDEDIMQIDSDRQGSVKESEWKEIKQRLFNIDKHSTPKVIVSVLMLREGFDVSNVCVIVPLRSSQAPILLEQVIGRGLRLMWREKDYLEIKAENRYKMFVEHQDPNNYLDILSIIEHPAFIQFYDDLENDILSHEGDVRHNTITPCVRKIDDTYYLYLILRNNRCNEIYPDGIFHAHPEYHHIKHEGIGIIEAMGLFILPARLIRQFEQIMVCLKNHLNDDEIVSTYPDMTGNFLTMIHELKENYSEETIDKDIRSYINKVCMNILKNTAVFKEDEKGQDGFIKFLKGVNF